jgi:phosphocarrier protein FPr
VVAAGEGVLVAPDLTPAEAAELDPARVVAVVLAHGSPTAHAVILSRGKGIPMVVGAGDGVLAVPDGTLVAVDGGTGEVVVDPAADVVERFRARRASLETAREGAFARAAEPAVTADGQRVLVGANVGSRDDAVAAAASGADLAGLVRTEFLFLGRDSAPDVDEQQASYLAVAEALGGRRMTLRTLDVGGDKPLSYVPTAPEANPFLGVRGLRLSLGYEGLFADQLLAVVRTAHVTPVSVMFPMVTTVAEVRQARALLDEAIAKEGRGVPAGLQVGIMVEVPATALKTAAFAPLVDFFSIGTNDLTQYTLAAERGNGDVAALGDPYDPGVLRLVEHVCDGASGALVAVCGELAADPQAAPLLVGMGVRELSVSPLSIPQVKEAVRAVDTGAARGLAALAVDCEGPDAVRALLAGGSRRR